MNQDDQAEDADARLKLQGVHIEFTSAMQAAMREKFAAPLRHNDSVIRINVRLQQDQRMGNEHHYTATAQIEIGGPDIIASAEGKEAYAVLDAVVVKLDRQLEKRHGRRKDNRNHPEEVDLDAQLPKLP